MTAFFYLSYGVLWLLVVFQSLVLLGLVQAVYRTNASANAGPSPMESGRLVGARLPPFTAFDISGTAIDQESLVGQMNALLFVAPGCSSCMTTLSEFDSLRQKVSGNLVIVCRAGLDECTRLRDTYDVDGVPIIADEGLEISRLFDVRATPTAVLVGADGLIQSYGQPMSAEELRRLIDEQPNN